MTAHGSPDRVSLEALLAHRDWVRALARRLVLDENDADDVEQETWRMAVERPPRHAESLRAWLAAVVRNAARGSGRRRSRRLRHEAATPARREVPSPEDLVAAAEVQTRLARAVLELDEPYRSTVLYRFHEGLAASEIAARLGVPVETVRTRLKRAIERLRERMGVELGDDRDAWALLVLGVRESAEKVPQTVPALSSAAAVAGGLAMAIGAKAVAATVVIVAAGVAWWLVPRDDGTAEHREQASSAATAPVAPPRAAVAAKEPRVRAAPTADDAKPATDVAVAPVADGDVVHGRVIDDETQAPVAKVTVSLVWENARHPEEPSSVTGDDGTFRIAGGKDGQYGDLFLTADGYADTIVGVPWRDSGTTLAKFDAGDVRIYRGKRVTGRVLAADGRTPVAGARIALSKIGGGSGTMWFSHAKEYGRAGDDGRFELERVPPSPYTPYTLMAASADGVGWTPLAAVAGRADVKDVEVRLRPTGSVTVTVQDESGTPQRNARVYASPRFEPLGPPSYGESSSHSVWLPKDSAFATIFGATTDAAGVARLTKLPIGDEGAAYDFIVHGRGVAWQDHVVVAAGEEKAITIVVAAPKLVPLVAGVRVVDPDGKPVEGASVAVVHGPVDLKGMSDADGVAIVQRKQGEPSAGFLGDIAVTKDGFARQTLGIKLLPDDGSPLPTVTLARPAPIEGRVVDQDGKPVLGCSVSLMEAGMGSPTTGADGKFAFPDATAGEWTLRVMKPKPWDQWADVDQMTAVRGGDRDVVVSLRRLPAGKAQVAASVVDADTGTSLFADEAWLISAVRGDEPIRVADPQTDFGSGTVAFARIRPGRWRLWIRVANRAPAVAGFEVAEGQSVVAVRVEIGRAGVLRGRVELGDSGLSLPPMVIATSTDDWTRPQWAKTEADGLIGAASVRPDGTFSFPSVVPGRYRVWTHAPGFIGEGFADVAVGGVGEAVVTFTKAGTLTFRMAGASPTYGIQYEVAQGAAPWRMVMHLGGMKGKTYDYDATLVPGRYRWRVTFPAHSFHGSPSAIGPIEGDVTVVAGETVVVDVPVVAK